MQFLGCTFFLLLHCFLFWLLTDMTWHDQAGTHIIFRFLFVISLIFPSQLIYLVVSFSLQNKQHLTRSVHQPQTTEHHHNNRLLDSLDRLCSPRNTNQTRDQKYQHHCIIYLRLELLISLREGLKTKLRVRWIQGK